MATTTFRTTPMVAHQERGNRSSRLASKVWNQGIAIGGFLKDPDFDAYAASVLDRGVEFEYLVILGEFVGDLPQLVSNPSNAAPELLGHRLRIDLFLGLHIESADTQGE